MADPVKRWTVLYTKHLKQKRKVYQDGHLLLSNNKVVLYDDSENALSGRFLKQDETVVAGETLAFESFLVDIGEPENAGLVKEEKLNCSSPYSAKRSMPGRPKFPASNLSPTQRIIKEFKKQERLKYVPVPQPRPSSSTDSIAAEWEALYTTHLTQKAKKFHDGFVRLVNCGTQGRQVKLYDASKELLSSRFAKKDEVICSGEIVKFDGYLVDIGNPKANQESAGNSKVPLQKVYGDDNDNDRKMSVPKNKPTKNCSIAGEPKNTASFRKDDEPHSYSVCSVKAESSNNIGPQSLSISSAKTESRSRSSSLMPLRGANEILSILKKPQTSKSIFVKEEVQFKEYARQVQDVKQTVTFEEKQKKLVPIECIQESTLKSDHPESEVSLDKHSCLGDSFADSLEVPLSSSSSDALSSIEKPNISFMTASNIQPMTSPTLLRAFHEPSESEVASSRGIPISSETCHLVKIEPEEDTGMSCIALDIKSSVDMECPSFDLGF